MRTHTETHSGPSVAVTVSLVVLAVGLVVTAADLPMAWLVWPVGYGAVLPLAISYAKRSDRQSEPDRLADEKQRYVAGDIDEREFEAAVEEVLEDRQ